MQILLGLLIGFVLGGAFILFLLYRQVKNLNVGSLRIDNSDPSEKSYLFLELSKDIESFQNKRLIILHVNKKDFLPRQ